MCVVMEEKEEV